MDCPTGLNPNVPPLEEDTLEQLVQKIRWHEWKAIVETDPEEKRRLWEKERQLREEKRQLREEKREKERQLREFTTGKLSPLGVAYF